MGSPKTGNQAPVRLPARRARHKPGTYLTDSTGPFRETGNANALRRYLSWYRPTNQQAVECFHRRMPPCQVRVCPAANGQ